MPEPPLVSVVIVNWNTRDLLCRCLASLQQSAPPPEEIIVVDNASTDGSAEMVRAEFPQIVLIVNPDNRMYAEGNNQGIAASHARYVWLLNADTEVATDTLTILVEFLDEHRDAGAVACRLVFPPIPPHLHTSVQSSVRTFPAPSALWFEALGLAQWFPRHRSFGGYRMSWWNYDDVREVDQPMASSLMIRRAALEEVGFFDPQFPLYFNDVDLCYRLRRAGWKIFFTPQTQVIHHVGASTSQLGASRVRESHAALLRYYRKHYAGRLNPMVYAATCALIRFTGWVRARYGPRIED